MAASMSVMKSSASKGLKQDAATFEQEQDANSALSDLDRGLRSMKVGVQCEAVVRFPRLFEKYPFPILINSAFLRLADVFRAGNNFIRWCILRVTLQSQKHLDKILNVDEFMRRIFNVYHSNDSIARALTLRTLGSISIIIAERKNIHHSITVSLDSNDAVEVDAAIYAAQKFSEQSSAFAANICDKVSEMINSIATPVDLKLSLIPVLQYMHHDVAMATKARTVCLSLLSSYLAEKFVMLTLRTMSHLAAVSLTDIPAQIELLLQQLEKDLRKNVKIVCLQELRQLSRRGAHLWTYQHVLVLCGFVQRTPHTGLKLGALHVLNTLSKAVTFKIFFTKQDFHSSLLDVCNLCYQCEDATLVSKVVEFYTNVVISYSKTKGTEYWCGQNLVDGAMTAIQTQILVSMSDADDGTPLKVCLRCAVDLVKYQPKTADTFVTCIASLLLDSADAHDAVLCECLAGIGSINHALLPKSVIPQLLTVLQHCITSHSHAHKLQVYLCTVLFQAADGAPIPANVDDMILTCVGQADPWSGYKIARQALRYGQCAIAQKVFDALAQKVSSEHFYFWLIGLRDISQGEKCLQKKAPCIIPCVLDALTHYHKGLTSLKAAVVPSFPLQFQCEYVQLRAALLEIHVQVIRTCNTFRTCPPPAIATALALANAQEITKCEHIVSQLVKSSQEYGKISEKFAALYQQSFDADPASLQNVLHSSLQLSCELMKLAIMSITPAGQESQGLLADKTVLGVGEVTDADVFKQLLYSIHTELSTLLQTEGTQAITYKHMDFLSASVTRLATAPNCFPRYFFQSLQQTSLKLAISPQQTANEPVLVQSDTQLTLKVEGVIQHGERPGLFRNIHSIAIHVTSNIVSRPNSSSNSDTKQTDSTSNTLERSVVPHNDYFSVSLILAFPVVGVHVVSIEAAIIDSDGAAWNTGPRVGLQVKSYDDALQRGQPAKHVSRPSFSGMITS